MIHRAKILLAHWRRRSISHALLSAQLARSAETRLTLLYRWGCRDSGLTDTAETSGLFPEPTFLPSTCSPLKEKGMKRARRGREEGTKAPHDPGSRIRAQGRTGLTTGGREHRSKRRVGIHEFGKNESGAPNPATNAFAKSNESSQSMQDAPVSEETIPNTKCQMANPKCFHLALVLVERCGLRGRSGSEHFFLLVVARQSRARI